MEPNTPAMGETGGPATRRSTMGYLIKYMGRPKASCHMLKGVWLDQCVAAWNSLPTGSEKRAFL